MQTQFLVKRLNLQYGKVTLYFFLSSFFNIQEYFSLLKPFFFNRKRTLTLIVGIGAALLLNS